MQMSSFGEVGGREALCGDVWNEWQPGESPWEEYPGKEATAEAQEKGGGELN